MIKIPNISTEILIIAAFLLGIMFPYIIGQTQVYEKPLPFSLISFPSAPQSGISTDDIIIRDDEVIIKIANSSIGRYASTGSMLPVLNENSKGIRITVNSPEQLHIGDIITYKDKKENLVVHRIITIGFDEEGTYYITKGDNNLFADERIRLKDIQYKLVALVY